MSKKVPPPLRAVVAANAECTSMIPSQNTTSSRTQFSSRFTLALLIAVSFWLASAPSVLAASLSKPPNNLGLVGYWSFNEGTGLKASDFSSSGNTGTINGATWAGGRQGGGLRFDGVDDNVTISGASALNISNAVTISAWVKLPTGFDNNHKMVVSRFGPSLNWYLSIYQKKAFLSLWIDGVQSFSAGSRTLSAERWHHVVASWDSATDRYKTYLDGVADVNVDMPGNAITSDSGMFIGTFSGADFLMSGSIDEVRVYNRAISDNEVTRLYQSGQATIQGSTSESNTGLVGHWKFDDATGNSAVDSSGRGGAGVLTGGPKWTAGRLKGGLLLDTSDDHVVLPSGAGFSSAQDHAYASWVYPTSLAGTYIWLVDYGGGAGTTGSSLILYSATDVPGFFYAGGSSFVVGTRTIPLNQWSHIVASYNSATNKVTFYVNGTLDTETATLGAWTSPAASSHYIGRWFNGSYNFLGSMDDVRVYNRALTAEQVRSLYSSGTTRPRIVNQSSSVLTAGTSLASGLVGHWTFDGAHMTGTGGVGTAKDISGSGNHGTLMNDPARTIGRFGQAIDFDGTNDYISVPDSSAFDLLNFTVGAWIKIDGSATGDRRVVNQQGAGGYWLLHVGDNKFAPYLSKEGIGFAGYGPDLNDGKWHMILFTRDTVNDVVTIWVDDVIVGTVAGTNDTPYAITSTLYISSHQGGSQFFPGSIDEVRIYSRALSSTEVKQLYNLGR